MTKNLHIHLDLVGGLAGDMFLAGAIDAGIVDPQQVQKQLRKIGLGPVEVHTRRVQRGAIEGTHVEFSGWDPQMESNHRHLSTIRQMLADSELAGPVSRRALEMFERLGKAEARVHGMKLDDVHFHEVGAVDSILDFVAAAWIIESTKASWSVGAIPAGRGTIETAHGTIPVPAPATAKVLEGFEIDYRDVDAELVTPTGATIAATVAAGGGDRGGRLMSTGFGCGTRQVKGLSNVVRFVVMEREVVRGNSDGQLSEINKEEVLRLVTEIDDQSPELVAHAAGQLMEAGALDVVTEPVQMKKGRVGVRLAVLCRIDDEPKMVRRIFEETTTLGIRRQPVDRWVLDRRIETVDTPYGSVEVKVARWGDEVMSVSPEYESCVQVADAAGVSVMEVVSKIELGFATSPSVTS